MRDIVIFGGGYSVKKELENGLAERVKDREVWAINYIYENLPYPPKRLVFVDNSFHQQNKEELKRLNSLGVEIHAKFHPRLDPFIKTHLTYRNRTDPDYTPEKVFIGSHGLSGVFALSLAVKEQYDRIFALGYDWGSPSNAVKETHTNTKSDGAGKVSIYLNPDDKPNEHLKSFDDFKDFKNIYNVSPISHIKVFQKITYEEMYMMLEN